MPAIHNALSFLLTNRPLSEKIGALFTRAGGNPGPQLELVIRKNEQGKDVLFFPFIALSDMHLGTRYSRAKGLSHMMEHLATDFLRAVGDGVDLKYMQNKKRWNFPPWHRQVLAHLLRKNVVYFPGNHDDAPRGIPTQIDGKEAVRRQWVGCQVFGAKFLAHEHYTDPQGRVILIKHGDDYDNVVFGQRKGFWYDLGDYLHAPIASLDVHVRKIPGLEGFSVSANTKRTVKFIINRGFGVEKHIMRAIEDDPAIDGILYGHSHIGGIRKTPGGKLCMNSGSSTEHVEFLVHDRKGVYAFITWHWRKNCMEILEENGHRRTVHWPQLGLHSFCAPPTMIEDAYTNQADRLIRVIYRLAPPKERQAYFKALHQALEEGREAPEKPPHLCLPPHPDRAAPLWPAVPRKPKRKQKRSRPEEAQPLWATARAPSPT